MKVFLIISVITAATAYVCPPRICDEPAFKDSAPLQCQGSVMKGGGFCGCTDACYKLRGESCQATPSGIGRPSVGTCDKGLTCVPHGEMVILGLGRCESQDNAKAKKFISSSDHNPRTTCEEQRLARMISMVVWQGMWTPVCDADGAFLPQQCDNMGKCFCVDTQSGHLTSSKVIGKSSLSC